MKPRLSSVLSDALRGLIVLASILANASFCARSGEVREPERLPVVVVTAPNSVDPSPAPPPSKPPSAPISPTRSTPGGASIVGVQKFIEGRTGSVRDLFEDTPGVFVESDNGAQSTRISIRGSGIQADGILGISFLLDGIQFHETDGEALLEDVDLLAIKGAEVYRGANALRYGAISLGGAINFLPRTGYDADTLGLRFEAGSFGYFNESCSFGGVKGSTDYFIALQDIRSAGYRVHSAEDNQKFFGDAGFKIGGGAENRIYLSLGRLDREDPGSLTKEQLRSNPRQAGEDAVEQDFRFHWETVRLADKATLKFDGQTLSAAAFYQYRIYTNKRLDDEDDDPEGIQRLHTHDLGLTFNYDNAGDLFCHQNRLTLGASPSLEFGNESSYQNLDGRQGPRINADLNVSSNVVLYGEDQFHITDKLSVIGGLQLIWAERDFRDTFRPAGVADQSRDKGFYGANPKAGLLYDIDKDAQLFGNFARSFQPPSFDDLAAVRSSLGVIYVPLRAQTGSTIEAGGRGERGRFEWDLSLYRTWLHNELLALKNAHGDSIGTVNAESTIHQGIEAGLDMDVIRGIAVKSCDATTERDRIVLKQSYTLNDFHFSNDRAFGGNRIAGIPVDWYNAHLEYRHPAGFYAGPGIEWNMTKYPVDHANSLYADSYALLDFRAGYKSKHGYTLFFQAKNLTNQIYAATVEAQSDVRSGGEPDAFRPGNGRAFYGGVSFKW